MCPPLKAPGGAEDLGVTSRESRLVDKRWVKTGMQAGTADVGATITELGGPRHDPSSCSPPPFRVGKKWMRMLQRSIIGKGGAERGGTFGKGTRIIKTHKTPPKRCQKQG